MSVVKLQVKQNLNIYRSCQITSFKKLSIDISKFLIAPYPDGRKNNTIYEYKYSIHIAVDTYKISNYISTFFYIRVAVKLKTFVLYSPSKNDFFLLNEQYRPMAHS